ncbi:hypothetical protein [Sutcliffiella cohnii]|uniref:hypothetical protein n=1 Tax=Sutcliffiella cohnii TaxID=33932 RepID=UPI00082EC0BC|nr:hypothetical protein [Sutcliffiella cohnii]
MSKKIELDSSLFVEYYDSGAGNPFDNEKIKKFCLENIEQFEDAGAQQDPDCLECDKEGHQHTWVYPFYDDEESYNELSKYIDDLPSYEEVPEELAQIVVLHCVYCKKWSVTH